jgi:phage head maturation protease
MSIGIIPRDSYTSKGNRYIKAATLIEISVVTIGANPQAQILSVEKCLA